MKSFDELTEKELTMEYIFTFGSGQIPGLGYFCRISAPTYEEAREIMIKRTLKFCGQYPSEEAAGVFRYNLTECYWDEVNRGWSEYPI